jgi:sarcosine oxidase
LEYDAIVLGIGGMGSATAYHLAKRGCKILGLERFNIGHEMGSSHGVNRIIRLAYAEDPRYVPLLRRAYELWREIDQRLLIITGGLDVGPEHGSVVQGSLRSCREHSLSHELLNAAEINRRFPGYRLPATMVGVYQPDGGFVLSDQAILTYVTGAQSLGAEIHAREAVLRWEVERGEVVVHTDVAAYRAGKLVITAGPWAAQMIPGLPAVPERQVVIWTQPKRPELFQSAVFPVFNMEADEGRYYGTPGFKLGKYHHREERVDPDRMDRECHPEDEEVLRKAIRRYFPDADGPTMAMKTCLFTNSPDGNFILDLHPDFPQVSIAAGFSGHGFKFASVVGEIMADFALEGGCSRFDLSLFSLNSR